MEKNLNLPNGLSPATDLGAVACSNNRANIVRTDNGKLDEKLSQMFMLIGIPAHITGYHYLREAVKISAGNFEMVNGITKKLYPLIAAHFNTNTCKVARGIHNAIEVAWARGKLVNLNLIFGIDIYGKNEKPSNGELIALLAEKIYLDSM